MRRFCEQASVNATGPSSNSMVSPLENGQKCTGPSVPTRSLSRIGVRFFVYGNLDYTLKKAGYNSKFRTGHYDGKGRIGEWILLQNQANRGRMGAAVFTTGPYMEMAFSSRTRMTPRIEDGVVTWRVPLGEGALVHVALEDCGYYVRWLFDNSERANGMDLEVAIEHVKYADVAAAFERVTGHRAQYIDTDVNSYSTMLTRPLPTSPQDIRPPQTTRAR